MDGGNVVLKNIKYGIGLSRNRKRQEIRIQKRKCVHLHSLSNILENILIRWHKKTLTTFGSTNYSLWAKLAPPTHSLTVYGCFLVALSSSNKRRYSQQNWKYVLTGSLKKKCGSLVNSRHSSLLAAWAYSIFTSSSGMLEKRQMERKRQIREIHKGDQNYITSDLWANAGTVQWYNCASGNVNEILAHAS